MEEKKIIKYKLVRHKWPDEIAAEKRVRRRKIMTAASLVVCFIMGYFASWSVQCPIATWKSWRASMIS